MRATSSAAIRAPATSHVGMEETSSAATMLGPPCGTEASKSDLRHRDLRVTERRVLLLPALVP